MSEDNRLAFDLAVRRNAWLMDEMLFFREFLGLGRCTCNNGEPCFIDHVQYDVIHDFCDLVRAKKKKGLGIQLSEIERELAEKRGESVQSGKGPGKTFMASLIAIWFFVCFEGARVIIMGPKYDQIKSQIWGEIMKWLGHAEKVDGVSCLAKQLMERVGDTVIMKQVSDIERGRRWLMRIKTFPKNSSIEEQQASVQGEHEKNMLFIIDESSGVPDHVFEAVEATLTDDNNSVFAIYNPNKSHGWALETQTKMSNRWVCKHINSENSPRVSKESIAYMEQKYGRDSNKFRISVLGLPPLQEDGSLIPWDWIQYAKDLWNMLNDNPDKREEDAIILGIDIGGGGDKSMCCKRRGNFVEGFESNGSADTHVVGNWTQRLCMDANPDCVVGDGNGIGNKVFADLKAMNIWKIFSLVSQSSSTDRRCQSMRDMLFWRLRTLFEDRLIAIPDDDELEGELSLLRYDDEGGQGLIKIVSKKDPTFKREMLSRLQYKSPNKADALSLTCYYDERMLRMQKMKAKDNKRDYLDKSDKRSGYDWMCR